MTRRILVLAIATLLVPALGSPASAQRSMSGFGARYAVPRLELADTHEYGWGLNWSSLANMGSTWVSLGGGWTRFEPRDDVGSEGEEGPGRLQQGEVTFGLGIVSGQLHLGARAGYFFRDEDEWDLMPVATVRMGPLLVSAEAKVLGDVRWYGGTVSWLGR